MRYQNLVRMLGLLLIVGFAAVFGTHANSQTLKFFMESIESKEPGPHAPPKAYTGPQTVQGLMTTFDAVYNRRYSQARVMASFSDGVVYSSKLAISGEIDTRYPRAEWLQALLDSGISIENFEAYRVYLSKRHTLAFLEDNPDLREMKLHGISPTEDWEAYKAAYIEKLVKQHRQKRKTPAEATRKRIAAAKEKIKAEASKGGIQLRVPKVPRVPKPPRVPQSLNPQEMALPALQRLVNQLEQTVTDLERQQRWHAAEEVRTALKHAKKALEQIKTRQPKHPPKEPSRYPPL